MAILSITKLIFADGNELSLARNSIVVFVGANNAGKSAALKAIRLLVAGPQSKTDSAIVGIALERKIDAAGLEDYLAPFRSRKNPLNIEFENTMWGLHNLPQYWQDHGIGPIAGTVISMLSTEARLTDCKPPANIDFEKETAKHPFQRMYADRQLENLTSEIVRKAFDADLVIDRVAGNSIPAFVGNRPTLDPGEERVDLSYTTKVRALGRLEEQGDGIRSFVSIIARLLTEPRPIVLIDEPEAFLHPPQARLAGRVLIEQNGDRQTFIATHSSDVLQGLISDQSDSAPITVVRLSRLGEKSAAVSLDPDQLADLWKDPILRFSNILDGLFHHGVVVTESDADCRFYEALADAALPFPRPDLHYCYSGGKDRVHTVIRALAKLGLPVAAIVDFDVLNDGAILRRIVEAAGGEWSLFQADWQTVKTGVETKSNFLAADQFVKEISGQLKLCKAKEAVPREVLAKVKSLSRQASPWEFCKTAGLQALKGQSYAAADRLLQQLRAIGIFVVPVGEMERFVPSIEAHGPRWVEEVLKRDLSSDAELEPARRFVSQLAKLFE